MKITTKAVFDIETMQMESWEGFEYAGPTERAGGGPSQQQKDAAASQANLTNQTAQTSRDMLGIYKNQYAKIDPFATNRMQNGLPYYKSLTDFASGTNAKAFAPAYAALNRRLSSTGPMPSGFGMQARSDLDAARARDFDSRLQDNLALNETAKDNAAAMLTGQQGMANPLGWTGATMQGNQSIMQAPLASPGLGGLIGGIAGGALSAIPKF